MDFNLANKVAIITGSGRGVGQVLAEYFAAAGALVILASRSKMDIERNATLIKESGGQAWACPVDISTETGVKCLMAETNRLFGRVDILINNAAIYKASPCWETSLADWEEMIHINLTGTFLCTRAVLPQMIERRSGCILNISSTAASHFFPGFSAYGASKAGVLAFTKIAAEEVKEYDVRINALNLGLINTASTRARIHDSDPATWVQPEEVATVALFLASDVARAINGAVIDVTGKRL
ncbi:SDR family NAD(P)-dependent oxidoreductase [Moorella naiadis]|uniref:SDR family NAD(P)-dependent oxidoreductase n=1 Tax=Moorella naiadis (nom. illeg.) TaxID=3093670 RepID=UPI003D9C8C37